MSLAWLQLWDPVSTGCINILPAATKSNNCRAVSAMCGKCTLWHWYVNSRYIETTIHGNEREVSPMFLHRLVGESPLSEVVFVPAPCDSFPNRIHRRIGSAFKLTNLNPHYTPARSGIHLIHLCRWLLDMRTAESSLLGRGGK